MKHAGDGLSAIGVHAPEFEFEKSREAVAENARRLGLGFPHLVDPAFEYWRALDNHYWPTIYLVDRCGRIRHTQVGEVHSGRRSGRQVEQRLGELLRESDACAK